MQELKIWLILWITLIMIAWGKYEGYSQVKVTIPNMISKHNTAVFIPLLVSDLSGYGIIAYQFNVKFDSLVIKAIGVSTLHTLTEPWGNVAANIVTSGKMVVGAFGITELTKGDTLLKLVFKVIAKPGDSTIIILEDFTFNNTNPPAIIENGSLKITLPTDVIHKRFYPKPPIMESLSNYPEPFHDRTTISVYHQRSDQIEIIIVNLIGQQIKNAGKFILNSNNFSYDWDATDNRGFKVPPGVYFCIVKQNEKIIGVDRMVLIR